MRILLTNHDMSTVGGSQTYTVDLARALAQRRHEVWVYSPAFSWEYDSRLLEGGVRTRNSRIPNSHILLFDVGLMQQAAIFNREQHFLPSCNRKIQIIQGIIPEEAAQPGFDRYICISEETAKATRQAFPEAKVDVVTQGVDLEYWGTLKPPRETIGRVLCLVRHEKAASVVREACKLGGWEFDWINAYGKPVWDLRPHMAAAEVVVSVGRGVVEALAAGRMPFVYDCRSYNGSEPFGDGSIPTLGALRFSRRNNFSGRADRHSYHAAEMMSDIRIGWSVREVVRAEVAPAILEAIDIREKAAQIERILEETK